MGKMNTKKYIAYAAVCAVLAAPAAFVFSQDGKLSGSFPVSAGGSLPGVNGMSVGMRDIAETIEYLEFREVDIKDVLRQLSKQYGLNIIFSESVKGLITVQLGNVTIEEALDSIVTINGFVYSKKGKVIKVTTPAEADQEGKQTRVFRLNNADAGKLRDTIAKVLSSEGKVEADTRSNALIVTDNVTTIGKLEDMVSQLDETTLQVLIEAKFVETTLGTTEKLGVDWSTAIAAAGGKRPTTFPFRNWGSNKDMYPSQELSHTVADEEIPGSASYIANYSASPPTFTEVPGSAEYQAVHTIDTAFDYKGTTSSDPFGDIFPLQLSSFPMVGASYFSFGSLDFSQLQAVLGFLQSRSDTKLLSSPRIVTTDNKEAMIQVGQTVRIVSGETYDEQAKQTKYSYDKQEVGVILRVTPQVSPDSRIKLKLSPEVSSIVGYNAGTSIPIIGKRTAETEVVIKDGQTIIIGGLVKTEKSTNVKKLPFLGDLPFIGKLFSHSEESPSKTDLMIFVTARVIKEEEGSPIGLESGIQVSPLRQPKIKMRNVRDANE